MGVDASEVKKLQNIRDFLNKFYEYNNFLFFRQRLKKGEKICQKSIPLPTLFKIKLTKI